MPHLFEDSLRKRARQFISSLGRAGFTGVLLEDSFRDYTVKVAIERGGREYGKANLYYSPRTGSFSIRTHELKDKSIASALEDCWHGRDAGAASAGYEIYVDGSFINGAAGYGAVILKDGQVVEELSGPVGDEAARSTRQVAGELLAVNEALRWCRENGVASASVFYDYAGIEMWATGRWKANQPLTQEYARAVRDSGVRVRWHKVDSHTGDRWNDRADLLAKKGAAAARPTGDSARASGLVDELVARAEGFIEFLMVKGIDACLDRVFNDQFARVVIQQDDTPVGIFDLYHTRKKPFSPYLHNFKDDELKSQVESLWKEFARR